MKPYYSFGKNCLVREQENSQASQPARSALEYNQKIMDRACQQHETKTSGGYIKIIGGRILFDK
jgi:hypothetical protein